MRPEVTFKIVPISGGLGILDEASDKLISMGEDLRNERETRRFIDQVAKERGLEVSAIKTTDGHVVGYEAYRRPVLLNLSTSQNMDDTLSRLASEMGISKGMAIVKAIALLEIAVQAKRDGKAFGVAETANDLILHAVSI